MTNRVVTVEGTRWTVSLDGAIGGGVAGPRRELPPYDREVLKIAGSDGRVLGASLPLGTFERMSEPEVVQLVERTLAESRKRGRG